MLTLSILVSHNGIDMYVCTCVPLCNIQGDDECDGGANHQEPSDVTHVQQNGIYAYLHS